ncbi:MAG: hypothetical protein C5B49_11455 [Bdellovibrio sp.]|nr:MAG: hypothetical protein C5B49_11455 [Bdellovibrio sp.]
MNPGLVNPTRKDSFMAKFLRRRYAITSRANEKMDWLKSLWTAQGIRKHGACLVFGAKIVKEVLVKKRPRILCEILREGEPTVADQGDIFQLSRTLFSEIDEMGTGSPCLAVEAPPLLPRHEFQAPTGLELICPFTDPQNLGAVARSSVGFGLQKIHLTKESAHPFLPRAIRASAGTVFDLQFSEGPPLAEVDIHFTSKAPHLALDMKGSPIDQVHWSKDMYLLLGEEGRGLPAGLSVTRATIPIAGTESLNAAVAAAIAIYVYRKAHPAGY